MVVRIALIILASVFLILGGYVLRDSYQRITQAQESRSWSKTTGTVGISQVVNNRNADNTTSYRAAIVYGYTLGESRYSSSRIRFGLGMSSSPTEPELLVAKYPKGATVDVYYNPASPGQSVLETGLSSREWMQAAVGAVFFAMGVAVAVLLRKVLRADRQAKKQ